MWCLTSRMIAAMELGGTKTVVAVGGSNGTLVDEFRFPTTSPQETLRRAVEWFTEKGAPEVIGIAAFGPVRIDPKAADWGTLLATPKPGWNGFSITSFLRDAFPAVRITLETDVNAACLAEARIGAAEGLESVAYITIGTGIGAGILCDGRLLHGALHPEFGHIRVPRKRVMTSPGSALFTPIAWRAWPAAQPSKSAGGNPRKSFPSIIPPGKQKRGISHTALSGFSPLPRRKGW